MMNTGVSRVGYFFFSFLQVFKKCRGTHTVPYLLQIPMKREGERVERMWRSGPQRQNAAVACLLYNSEKEGEDEASPLL